jgi:hypothetical protein
MEDFMKTTLHKMPHLDVVRPTADSPLSVQMDDKGAGWLASEKAGLKTTFPISAEDLSNVAMVLSCSDAVKNLAMHLMSYHAHDMERVVNFLNDVSEEAAEDSMSRINKKLSHKE